MRPTRTLVCLATAIAAALARPAPASAQDTAGAATEPGVGQPTLLDPLRPLYPREMLRSGLSGEVLVEAMVDPAGRVDRRSLRIVRSSDRRFEDAARGAVLAGRYRPGTFLGRPARLPVRVTIAFTIRWQDLMPDECRILVPPGSLADTVVRPDTVAPDILDQRPEVVHTETVYYPEVLRQAAVEGRVLLELVLDTRGCVETGSMRVLSTAHDLFIPPALAVAASTRFRPGRINGQPVRTRVQLPINFTISR